MEKNGALVDEIIGFGPHVTPKLPLSSYSRNQNQDPVCEFWLVEPVAKRDMQVTRCGFIEGAADNMIASVLPSG